MNIALPDALAGLADAVRKGESLPSRLHISTDTRTLVPGDTFVALRGERFDGHAFVREALTRGAAAVVVDDASALPDAVAALVVGNTTLAYMAFAQVARRSLGARVIAVTGSAGKTTTKSLIAQILTHAGIGPVAFTPSNENNEIGVSKLFLDLDIGVRWVVVEFGARHFGDIEPLVRIAQPELGVLTNIGEAHLEIMGSRERLIQTKFGLFSGGAQPILNFSDATSRQRGRSVGEQSRYQGPHWFDYVASPAAAYDFDTELRKTLIIGRGSLRIGGDMRGEYPVRIDLPGEHNLINLSAACAAVLAAGVEAEAVVAAIPHLTLPPGRYERSRLGAFEIIFDAYNASPSGALATLRSFACEPALRRIAVLASMAELGDESPVMHERVGEAAANAGLNALLVSGRYAEEIRRGAHAAGFASERIVQFECNEEATAWLRANASGGDLVLFKGSRMYRLEQIVEALRAGT